jgi:hypothetical protein
MVVSGATNSGQNNAAFTGLEPSGGIEIARQSMNQKTISRNELLLTDGMVQRFEEPENPFTYNFLTVSSEAFDGVVIAIGDGNSGCEIANIFIEDDDVERLAQAILVHGGKAKVVE